MRGPWHLHLTATLLLSACAAAPTAPDLAKLREQVIATEAAFARSMAERDRKSFTSFLSAEAIFVSDHDILHGRAAVAERWGRYFTGTAAPFSWQPKRVDVNESGTLAYSSGPVFDAGGRQIGTFSSIWRQEAPGTWRIVFDSGCEVCNCEQH